MVRGEHDVGVGAEEVDRLGEVARPRVRVAHQGTSDREDVVEDVRGVLGDARARRSGKWKCISAGASEPGAIWKTMRRPSTTCSSPVVVISRVGAMRVTVPTEVVWARPAPTCPCGPRGSAAPYMYPARRAMATPA